MKKIILYLSMVLCLFGCSHPQVPRQEISLNGLWQIAKTDSISQTPTIFPAQIEVPGLVELAAPTVDDQDTAYNSAVYWYKRSVTIENPDSEVVQLKINKSAYHTRVFLNGQFVGDNVYSFTPSLFNLKPFLNKENKENELLIAVGCRNNLPDTVTHGGDFEKIKYTPGIYDDVKLIVSNGPFIANVQTVPDINSQELRVVAEIQSEKPAETHEVSYSVREAVSKKVVAEGVVDQEQLTDSKIDFKLKIPGCQLWSPESPFLYDLELRTSGDNLTTRFGMRSFEASKDSGVFLLNGKPYFMRGTNVCIFRFFEDRERKNYPWDSEWATLLHSRFKELKWNSIRYCIGFPPERWYEIADSLGFLVQDEYPIWTGGKGGFENLMGKITAQQMAAEYAVWMRERWNHPSVVVWDAQNESVNDTTAKAFEMVRYLDLSNRPWDNGWAAPARESDAIESHPYLFTKYMGQIPGKDGYLKELLHHAEPLEPRNDPNEWSPPTDGKPYTNPVIINEYGWLWLNRDGSPTHLTQWVYKNVFPEDTTTEIRFEVYAKTLAILTEYWRCHRNAAAVMHFCGLGYSRAEKPFGYTSDNFTNIGQLTFEPHFYQHMKMAFSPVGLMVEMWEKSLKSGQEIVVPVYLINDTYEVFIDSVRLSIWKDQQLISLQSAAIQLNELQKRIIEFSISTPTEKGNYRMEAEIKVVDEPIISTREFSVN